MNIGNVIASGIVFVMSGAMALHAVTVSDVTARQRYPWNGLVDVRFNITGDSNMKYDIALMAKDMEGGTNVTMKTIRKSDGSLVAGNEQFAPGTYNWIWDAATDLPKDWKCNRVTVTVTAVAHTYLYMVIDLSSGANSGLYPVSYLDAVPSGGWDDTYKTTKLVLRRVAKGSNSAGGSMTKDMWVGIFEVTGQQYVLVKGTFSESRGGSTYYKPDSNPTAAAGCMDYRCKSFLSTLKSRSGVNVRLPTASEWQYACRAGTKTDYNNGTSASKANMNTVGWHSENIGTTKPAIVGKKAANAWGLYDMHGNQEEQVSDIYFQVGGEGGCFCGGSWDHRYLYCTSKFEHGRELKSYILQGGFRVFADME